MRTDPTSRCSDCNQWKHDVFDGLCPECQGKAAALQSINNIIYSNFQCQCGHDWKYHDVAELDNFIPHCPCRKCKCKHYINEQLNRKNVTASLNCNHEEDEPMYQEPLIEDVKIWCLCGDKLITIEEQLNEKCATCSMLEKDETFVAMSLPFTDEYTQEFYDELFKKEED